MSEKNYPIVASIYNLQPVIIHSQSSYGTEKASEKTYNIDMLYTFIGM